MSVAPHTIRVRERRGVDIELHGASEDGSAAVGLAAEESARSEVDRDAHLRGQELHGPSRGGRGRGVDERAREELDAGREGVEHDRAARADGAVVREEASGDAQGLLHERGNGGALADAECPRVRPAAVGKGRVREKQ